MYREDGDLMKVIGVTHVHDMVLYVKGKQMKTNQVNMKSCVC
jgi:hypothetical protein